MTTESESIQTPRDISELLRLQTYQGMTDEEIDTIIQYKCTLARSEGQSSELVRLSNAILQQNVARNQAASAKSALMVQSALTESIPWVRVSNEGTVIANV
mgnify:CR=1 FL=1